MQADLYDAITRRFLEDAGVSEGMKVLDVGSGAGDVAFLAAKIVGPTGTVVGVDVNPEVLATARSRAQSDGRSNVTFVDGDCLTAAIRDDFDAAVGRFVLMHAPDAQEMLRSVAARVRSGGVVAFAEGDLMFGMGYAHAGGSELIAATWDWTAEAFRRLGIPTAMAPVLCRAFPAVGLGEPHMTLHAPLGCRQDWPGFEVDAETFASMAPLLEQFGIVDAETLDVGTLADRYRREVLRTATPFLMLPLVTAWGRRPTAF
jgi:SAM-dependent methyltransferase